MLLPYIDIQYNKICHRENKRYCIRSMYYCASVFRSNSLTPIKKNGGRRFWRKVVNYQNNYSRLKLVYGQKKITVYPDGSSANRGHYIFAVRTHNNTLYLQFCARLIHRHKSEAIHTIYTV